MEQQNSTNRRERVLSIVQANTLEALNHPNDNPQWIHAGMIAERLDMDRTNVSRELNNLYRSGDLIKFQGKPTLYISRSVLAKQFPDAFFPSTLPKGSRLEDFVSHREVPEQPAASPDEPTELESMVGVSGSLFEAVSQAKAAVIYPSHTLHCLITGSVGVGKGKLARSMYDHALSKGAFPPTAPFITVNCQERSTSPQIFLNQIFGCSRDAAPKGEKSRRGLIDRAEGGILCIDNIDKLPVSVQDTLITLLEKNVYSRIGEASVTRKANVMVIGISTEDPESPTLQTLAQRFPIHIHLPDLKDRSINELAQILIHTFQQEALSTGISFKISKEVFACFLKAGFPGNLGELSSIVRTSCSLVYLEYSASPIPPKIMEICFRHLPQNALATIQENAVKDQQIRDLLQKSNFSYLLFSPNGFTADCYTGPQFLELLNTPGTLSQPDTGFPIPLAIANEYLKRYLDKAVLNHIEHAAVLQDFFPSSLIQIVQDTLTLHEDFAFLIHHPNEMYRLLSCLRDGLHNHLENILNAEHLLLKLSEICPGAAQVVRHLQKSLKEVSGQTLSESVMCYLIACLHMAVRANLTGGVPIILVCHGKAIAENMAAYVNSALNTTVAHGVCFSENMPFDELLSQVTDLAQEVDQGNGILLMVDMVPLTELHEHILTVTGIHAETISNINLPLVLHICRRAMDSNITLHMLVEEARNSMGIPRQKPSFLERTVDEVLAPSLVFLNPQKASKVLFATLTNILQSLNLVWSTEIAIKFLFHCSHMIERLMQGECLKYSHLKVFVNQQSELMHILELHMQYPSEVFGISIPASELAYIAEIFLDYLDKSE